MTLREWAREPLVHFIAGGLAIFALFAWLGEPADPASRTIRLTQADQAQLALGFERAMGRPPAQAELDALIERWIRDEVLYREALRLGLDEDDPVIRRRLAQKMDVIAASAADAEQPSDAELQRWLEAHPARFVPDAALSFDQLYFPSREAAQAAIGDVGGSGWRDLGRPIALPQSFEATARNAVADQLGEDFTRALDGMAADGRWRGPVASPLGWHLVRLRERKLGALPQLAAIRTRVENDWRAETERMRQEAGFRVLRDAYTVKVDR